MLNRAIKKILILKNILIGFLLKYRLKYFFRVSNPLPPSSSKSSVIISLTSYGRRVGETLIYTLLSIYNQSVKPNKIVLWLDQNEYSINDIPSNIIFLQKYGLEIFFTENIKSYKKLIPSLKKFPNDIIITIDDDLIYNKNLIKTLLEQHYKMPNVILAPVGSDIQLDNNGKILPYQTWKDPSPLKDIKYFFPWGGSGKLYPPGSLHCEVLNENVFQSICPLADDIWFWAMAVLNHTPQKKCVLQGRVWYSFDDLYQYFHKGTGLTYYNDKKNENQSQLDAVINHYNIRL